MAVNPEVPNRPFRLVVGVSGASGAIYAKDLLVTLASCRDVEVHLVVSRGGTRVLAEELSVSPGEFFGLAHAVYDDRDVGAAIASGSFITRGMVVVPSSASSLAKIAHGIADTLLTRAAMVHLKERRPLILVLRETPLAAPTIEAMLGLSRVGAVIMPASPGFYHRPGSVDELAGFMTQRILDHLGIEQEYARRWKA